MIDAIDSFNHKIDLIEKTGSCGVTLFSSMGMALKVDPSKIKYGSVWKTDVCSLARHVRQELRKRGFTKDFTAVYSVEPPATEKSIEISGEKRINGSIITVTASAGLMLASLVINDILKNEQVF